MNNMILRMKVVMPILFGSILGASVAWGKSSWAVGLFVLLILIIISFKKMEYTFWAMVFFLPFTRVGVVEAGPFSVQPSQAIVMVLIVTLILNQVIGKKQAYQLVKTPLDIPVLLFFFVCLISVYQSYHIPYGYINLFETVGRHKPFLQSITQMIWFSIGIFSYYVTVAFLKERKIIERTLRVMIMAMALASLFGIYQFIGAYLGLPRTITRNIESAILPGVLSASGRLMRVSSVMEEPSLFSLYLLSILPLLLVLTSSRVYLVKKRWQIAIIILSTIALFLTFSRVTMVVVIMLVPLIKFLKRKSPGKKEKGRFPLRTKFLLGGFLIIFYIIFLSFILPSLSGMGHDRFYLPFSKTNFSTYQRLASWVTALGMFYDYPFLGVGVGNYAFHLLDYVPRNLLNLGMPDWMKTGSLMPKVVNNIYLETLAETGIWGFTTFALMLLLIFRLPLKMIRLTKDHYWFNLLYGSIIGVAAILIGHLFSSAFYFPYVWMAFGLMTAIERVAGKEKKEFDRQ